MMDGAFYCRPLVGNSRPCHAILSKQDSLTKTKFNTVAGYNFRLQGGPKSHGQYVLYKFFLFAQNLKIVSFYGNIIIALFHANDYNIPCTVCFMIIV